VIDAGDVGNNSGRHLSIFYTGLWRGLTFPRRIDEVTSGGKVGTGIVLCFVLLVLLFPNITVL
jgi:hypothetical protein